MTKWEPSEPNQVAILSTADRQGLRICLCILLIRRQLELKVLLYGELFPNALIDYDA